MNNTKTQVTTKVSFTGDTMKEIKNMVKKSKVNKAIDILNCIKVDVNNEKATLTYSTLDTLIQKTLDTLEGNTGTFLVPVDWIKGTKYIKKDSLYTFEFDSGSFKLHYNKDGVRQSQLTPDHEEYPLLPSTKEIKTAGVMGHDDLQKLKSACLSISKTDSRPVLQYTIIRGNKVISTDGHRLYQSTLKDINASEDIFFNNEMVTALINNENKKDLSAVIKHNKDFTVIETHNSYYMQRSYDDKPYPEIDRLIPESNRFKNVFTISDVKHFKNIIENINKLTKGERNHVMKLEVLDNKTISLTTGSEDFGRIEETINIQSDYIEEGFKISFSSQYVLDAINQVTSKNSECLQFNFVGNMTPFIINEKDNNDTLALVVPIRTF